MRLIATAIGGLLLLCAATGSVRSAPCDADPDEGRTAGQIVIVMRADERAPDPEAAFAEILTAFAADGIEELDPPRRIPELRAWLVRSNADTFAAEENLARRIRDHVDLQGREPVHHADQHFHFETPEGVQRALPDFIIGLTQDDFLTQPAASIIRAPAAGAGFTGRGVTVAVIDTASSLQNPTTAASMVGAGLDLLGGAATVDLPSNGTDDDGDGDIDESAQHGTFAAGLVHLAAPGARLLHVRALDDDGHGDSFTVAEAIVAAVQAGARVLNLSFGMVNEARLLHEAVDWAADRGAVVVAAAGNRGESMQCVEFPASGSIDHDLIAVAAVDDSLRRASFSSFGESDPILDEVSLSAPGVGVLSTFGPDGFAVWSGTSFAAPQVAGGAAILLERYPGLSPAAVRKALQDTAQPDDPDNVGMGAGVLDLGPLQTVALADRSSLELRRSPMGTRATWQPVAEATSYDLVRGEIRNLAFAGPGPGPGTQVSLGPLTCLGNDMPSPGLDKVIDDPTPTPPGGFFYLFRDDAPDADGGSYGVGSGPRARVPMAAPLDCAP